MKTVIKTSLLALLSFFILSGLSLREKPEDPPRGEKEKKLKMVKIEDGKKTVVDTVITGEDDVFSWFSNYDLTSEIDSVIKKELKNIEVIIDEIDGKEKVKVFAFDDKDFDMDFDFDIEAKTNMNGDSIIKVIVMKHGDGNCKKEIIHLKHPHVMAIPHPPKPPKVRILKHHIDGNFIDLDDPGIISYKKKDLSGDREKIEIIRKKSKLEDIDVDVEVDKD